MKSFQAQTYYELLEISVGATGEEVRNAYERLSRLYSDDQVVLYGLIEVGQAAALRDRLQEALLVLSDEPRRATYDAGIGLPPRELEPPPPLPPSLPPPVAPAPRLASLPSASSPGWSGISWVQNPVPAPLSPPHLLLIDVAGGSHSHSGRVAPPPVRAVEQPAPVDDSPPVQLDARGPPEAPVRADPPPPSEPPPPLPPPPVETEKHEENNPVGSGGTPETPTDAVARPREVRLEAKVKPFELGGAVEFNGDLIRQVRMARGVSLVQLAEKTRIGVRHLENLEADRYDALPTAVYLRGILVSVARELGLDGARVARSYLSFVEARRSKG